MPLLVAMTWPKLLHTSRLDSMAKLGLHTFAFAAEWAEKSFRSQADLIKTHQVKLLEIPLLRPGTIDADAVSRFAHDHGFEIVASLGLPHTVDVVNDPSAALAFLDLAFEDCLRMGSHSLSGVTYGTIGRTSGEPPTQKEIDSTAQFLQKAAAAAARLGLKLGIEPCNRYETHIMNTAQQAVDYVERIGAENLFIHLDTYHMHIEEQSFLDGLRVAAPYLGYIHLSESNRGVPGSGMLDWGAVFRGLADIGFDGAMTLESMNHAAPEIASGLAIWRPVAARQADVIEIGLPFLRAKAATANFDI